MTDHNIAELAHRILGADKVGRDLGNAASWDAIDLVLETAPALARAVLGMDVLVDPLDDDHPAVQAAALAALAEGWTCDTHEPLPWGECRDCTESHLRTARRALTAALPHLGASTPEPLPCGCENPFNAVHLLDH